MDHFSEDEVIGVEHLLAEPKCNNLGDAVLGFNTFSRETCCKFQEFSTLEYGSIKSDCDALDFDLKLCEKDKELLNAVLGRSDAIIVGRKNNITYTCDDYLLDAEFGDETCLNPIRGPCAGNMGLENKCTVSGGRSCGGEISEMAVATIPVLQTSCQDSSWPDWMTIDELQEAFRNSFGFQATVTDKQCLKRQLSFGLQNHIVSSNEDEGKMISPPSDQQSERACTPFTAAFNIRKRRRVQHVKREKHDSLAFLKSSSADDKKTVFGFSELGKVETGHVTSKRSRRPTRRYIAESSEQNSLRKKKRCGISNTSSRDKGTLNGSYKQAHVCRKGFQGKPFVFREVPVKGACIQVPFGEPIGRGNMKKKVHESDDISGLLDSNVDSDTESFSTKSQDSKNALEGKSGRKNHMYWSVSEVLKLVDGVSMYGVGKWREIKKLLFHSSANRTSVDIKDKWRNLLRASHSQLKSNREEVESKRKHGSKPIPQSILRRVRELASIYPYPRERKTTVSFASPTPGTSTTSYKLFPSSDAVRIM